jgi:hypothetical protein
MKVSLAFLIPALWLMASLGFPSDQSKGIEQSNPTLSVCGHDQDDSSISLCSFEQLARRSTRRLSFQSGLQGFPKLVLLANPVLLIREDSFFIPTSQADLGIANNWQFHWRTALQPRAPSLIS